MAVRDPSTVSNYDAWLTKHTTANLKLDFKEKVLRGVVTLELESQTDKGSKEVILDSSYLSVSSVKVNSNESEWQVKERAEPLGSPVHISVPAGAAKSEVVKVDIELATTDKCTALQWLTAAQTSNNKAPFMFSQCQAIHARSLFPCQDTPDVKSTYSFRITSPHVVVASGVASGEPETQVGGDKLYSFEQKVPIPSYLFALASGDIATAPIGPRSLVATSPDKLDGAKWEFEHDMETFMEAAEKLVFPYQWGQYNVLVLPPSFPWLNEGWTMYLERRINASIHGPAHFDFSAVIGWTHLEDAIQEYGKDHEYTQLSIPHKGIDPDDAFSTVPYEKGFHMIYYLERLVGRANFDKFIPYYFEKWSRKSLDSYDFKATFLEFFGAPEYSELKDKIASIDWETRFYSRGLPPKPEFDTSLIDVCYKLADQWKDKDFTPSAKDVEGLAANQKLVYLGKVQNFSEPLSAAQAEKMGDVYGFLGSKNVELKVAYFHIALRSKVTSTYPLVAELLGEVGRMKFVRPLFRALNKVDRALAVKTFEKNKDFYHPICRAMVEKDLGVAAEAK
ncbi:putative leukotriene a-4 hydrolase [Diaporthe ampelina]|uniref:Putative leukotriene a-4 hydrolase n=1 Tax=Diaporthe ampelina TaxID=1214573 RepID=A0A0G2FJM1_9PEZI|nr:putative leukotriene a-4 hydrolase [Diaporthe ampelina]